MPPPLHTQTVIAFVWDFDKTLIPSNMQDPIFDAYDVDPRAFWDEVDGLVDHYRRQGVAIQRDIAYLGHLLTYVREGIFKDLTNERLRELGGSLVPAPGMPEFLDESRRHIAEIPEFADEGITVEHYVVSTGILPMIEGNGLRSLMTWTDRWKLPREICRIYSRISIPAGQALWHGVVHSWVVYSFKIRRVTEERLMMLLGQTRSQVPQPVHLSCRPEKKCNATARDPGFLLPARVFLWSVPRYRPGRCAPKPGQVHDSRAESVREGRFAGQRTVENKKSK